MWKFLVSRGGKKHQQVMDEMDRGREEVERLESRFMGRKWRKLRHNVMLNEPKICPAPKTRFDKLRFVNAELIQAYPPVEIGLEKTIRSW